MRNIIIEFLNEEDHLNRLPEAKHQLDRLQNVVRRCRSTQEVYECIDTISTDSEAILVTVLSHGNQQQLGMQEGGVHHTVPYAELLRRLNNRIGRYPLILNLMASCLSAHIIDFENHFGLIQEVWVTNREETSMRPALIVAIDQSYDALEEYFEEDERIYYERLQNLD